VGTDALSMLLKNSCEPTENSGIAVTGITHANLLASVVGSIWIWMCAST
jgi:hypothetical protein